MSVVYNGVPLHLENCGDQWELCPANLFFKQMEEHLYQGDLEAACNQEPTLEVLELASHSLN